MGRVKRKIKRLENTNCRLATYAKRKNGIMKKAIGLSILCDVDIILIMFSPSGKPSLCRRKLSNFEEIIIKFAQLTSLERKKNLESYELHHDVIIQDSLARLLQTHINEIHKRLSYWTDLGKSNSENIQKQQFASLQCNNPFNEMHVSFGMDVQHHLQPLSWIINGDNQYVVIPEDSNLLFCFFINIEGSTSYSFGSHANYLGSSNKTDISISKQENGVLGDMRSTSPMRLQFSYLPNNFNLLNDMDIIIMTLNQGLISTSGPCVVTMFDEHLYTQPSFPPMHIGFT
ncbi:hypothetical protein AAZX31_02G103500 [Glycine max]